jgi:hypothetical protein
MRRRQVSGGSGVHSVQSPSPLLPLLADDGNDDDDDDGEVRSTPRSMLRLQRCFEVTPASSTRSNGRSTTTPTGNDDDAARVLASYTTNKRADWLR